MMMKLLNLQKSLVNSKSNFLISCVSKQFSQLNDLTKLKQREIKIVNSTTVPYSNIPVYNEDKWLKLLTTIIYVPLLATSGSILYMSILPASTVVMSIGYFKAYIWTNCFYQSFSFGTKIYCISNNFKEQDLKFQSNQRLKRLHYLLLCIILFSQYILWKNTFTTKQATIFSGLCLMNSFWFVKLNKPSLIMKILLGCGILSSIIAFAVFVAMLKLLKKSDCPIAIDPNEEGIKYKSLKESIADDNLKMEDEEEAWSKYHSVIVKSE